MPELGVLGIDVEGLEVASRHNGGGRPITLQSVVAVGEGEHGFM